MIDDNDDVMDDEIGNGVEGSGSLINNEPNYKEEYERLKGVEHKYQVEAGRLKKMSEDYKTLKKEHDDLMKQYSASNRKKVSDFVPEDVSAVVDDDVLKASASMVEGALDDIDSRFNDKFDDLNNTIKSEREARIRAEQDAFDTRVNTKFPGFVEQTMEGGAYKDLWDKFLGQTNGLTGTTNRDILIDAYDKRRLSSVSTLIQSFKKLNNIKDDPNSSSFPGGQFRRSLPPDQSARSKKTYTLSEWKAAMAKSRSLWSSRQITAEQRRKDVSEFEEALAEGRVLDDPKPNAGF